VPKRSFYRVLALAAVLTIVLSAQPAAASQQQAPGNGIVTPPAGSAVRGVIPVTGVAQSADFSKWQLDLLPAGDAGRAVFLAVGETASAAAASLAQLDSAHFPDGAYTLRLRVVRRDGNYDEHFTPITIANTTPVAGLPPAASSPPRLVNSRAAALGLATHTASGQPILYLTFDDGPSPTYTAQIIQLLNRYDAQATFFVIGVHVRRAPAALRPVAEAGHTIANHTLSHKSLAGRGLEAFSQELQATEEIVHSAVGDLLPAGQQMRYLRPPGGGVDANTSPYAATLGYKVVGWDIDPKDWRRPGAAAISSLVIQRALPGAIVVLHDGGGASQQTVVAVETILEELSQQGYVFHALPSGSFSPSRSPLPAGEGLGVRESPLNSPRSNTN
jgi:peptidoglycan/xylan/chitin deacetylase (PgdA/CDA1 family)